MFCAVATTIDTEIWQDRLSQGLPWTLRGATSQEMVMARLRAQRDVRLCSAVRLPELET